MKISAKKKPAAQVADEKKPQSPWLQQAALTSPAQIETPITEQSGPPRLLSKAEVLKIANVSYVTLWTWMRDSAFPRSRIVGSKSMWLSTEIDQWMSTLPVRHLKGDAA